MIVLLAKVMGVILFFMLARWSWPRFRYDQLMDIGWKVMIPWGLVNVVVVAVWMEYGAAWRRWWGFRSSKGWRRRLDRAAARMAGGDRDRSHRRRQPTAASAVAQPIPRIRRRRNHEARRLR